MPESVEVRLSSELIKPLVINKTITNCLVGANSRYKSNPPEGFHNFQQAIKNGVTVIDVSNKGKFMYWTLSQEWFLFCTFGMTGQWSPKEGKHPCLILEFDDSEIYFNDPRHFGSIKFVNDKQHLTDKLNTLGWDAFKGLNEANKKWIQFKLNSKKSIAQLLMDQSIFCGVGNYIKCEALYESKISPWRTGDSLTLDQITLLCSNITQVMETSYKHQGATISTYKTPYGEEGKYSSLFKVYGKQKDPDNYQVIRETTLDKRTSHWVPDIQK